MKRSMVSVMILAAVLAFLYVPIILVVVYGFVPNGISMSFFGSDGSFLGFTWKWYRYIFSGHQSVRALLQSFWLSLIIAGLSTLASCAIGTTSALATVMAVSVLIPIGLSMWWKKRQDMRDRQRLEAQTARLFTAGEGAAK